MEKIKRKKKTTIKKTLAKKKTSVKKTPIKKTLAKKKTSVKKTPIKKTIAKKKTSVKKTPIKKTLVKKKSHIKKFVTKEKWLKVKVTNKQHKLKNPESAALNVKQYYQLKGKFIFINTKGKQKTKTVEGFSYVHAEKNIEIMFNEAIREGMSKLGSSNWRLKKVLSVEFMKYYKGRKKR